MKKKKLWQLQKFDESLATTIATDLSVSPLVVGILLSRGFHSKDEIAEFLFGSETPFYEPLLMKDMQKAVERINQAIEIGEQITIYGDYDVDGITACSLLAVCLRQVGAKVNTYIPKRKSEGYGLNQEALMTLHEEGTTLLVTVDCGISGVNEVVNAPKGMDIIITDHHTPPEELPPAYAIINPHQYNCKYPFKSLSGVGVAFKLCQALHQINHITEPLWSEYSEFVALGTVADIVSLRGENRALVKLGLKAMESTQSIGLRKLMERSNCPFENISTENIGFILAPRLNAVGRLEHAQLAVELLLTQDAERATLIVDEMERENALRQEISRQIFIEAEEMLAQEEKLETAIVLAKEGWHAGVIGIVASRLVDKYHLPTVLISISGDTAKGSCRSIPTLDLYSAINECSEYLVQFGGHHQAAGLTLRSARVKSFKERFLAVVAGQLAPEDYQPRLKIDYLFAKDSDISLNLLKDLSLLEPFGCDNKPPLFAFKETLIHYPRVFGRDNNHLRFFIENGISSYHSIMWNGAVNLPCIYNNAMLDIAFMAKINVWQDKENVNLQVVDFDQDLFIYDYRHFDNEKEALLKNILQTGEKTVIYVNDIASWLLKEKATNVTLAVYGEKQKTIVDNVVFYDLPQIDIFTETEFPLSGKIGQRLILLYNEAEKADCVEKLNATYASRTHLVSAYKELAELLKKQAVVDKNDLLRSVDTCITANDLKIFEELNFICCENEKISFGCIQKKDLENSPTFRSLQECSKRIYENYNKNLQLTVAMISILWRTKS